MKAFRILLAFAVAGATFYSLNVLAIQHGYGDRLDFKNRYYHEHDCNHEHGKAHNHHHSQKAVNSQITPVDSAKTINR
ncbi:hypothetical protein ACFOWA_10730 [Pedobacter lithocola]|uniref:Uncharacterized protein n=1 Tax=Pedobacter lithocola TaxID=1908239 RepID=A0ABV8P8L7_9SPHI